MVFITGEYKYVFVIGGRTEGGYLLTCNKIFERLSVRKALSCK